MTRRLVMTQITLACVEEEHKPLILKKKRDMDELDREYNPRLSISDHAEIVARWQADSAAARSRLTHTADLSYGPSPAEKMDFFPAKKRGPLLVFIHGGYWRARDKSDFHFLATPFVNAGVSVAMPNYGLAPATSLEEIVRQTLRAISWLYHEAEALNFDAQRIVIAGHSAGGHLAAMMAAADWRRWEDDLPDDLIRGVVSISGLYNLVPLSRAPFLRDDLCLNEVSARHVSPIAYVPNPSVSLVTAVGSNETRSFHDQNRLIRAAWPECFLKDIDLPGRHHMTAVEALGEVTHPLFLTTLDLLGTAG